ncbi:MAG: winged helix-turn-helix transcriptional regulator [Chloroflexota bacterium]|nr:MAG: winged helix-turn-helix transcriptional regulator [Chloroflexota bacterium]
MNEEIKPAPVMMIKDLETLKILADPLRNQILEILAPEKLTVTQIADKLGLVPSKLYYHINLLEKHGLIQEVETVVKANIIEKIYWITAYECRMDENLCNFSTPQGRQSIQTTMVSPIETTREDILRSLEARATALEKGAEEHPRQVVIFREIRSMTDQQADEFAARIKTVLEDFEQFEEDDSATDAHKRALTVAYYPSFYYDPNEVSQ